MKALVKRVGYLPRVVELPDGDDRALLKELQRIVGGWICMAVRVGNLITYCDDEGLLKGYEINFVRPTDGSPIVGDVVVTRSNVAGDTVSLTDADVTRMTELLVGWSPSTDVADPEAGS